MHSASMSQPTPWARLDQMTADALHELAGQACMHFGYARADSALATAYRQDRTESDRRARFWDHTHQGVTVEMWARLR